MKVCRQCRTRFEPVNSLQVVCSPACAIQYATTEPARRAVRLAMAKERREYRDRTETLADATRKAQAAFNRWVRLRDTDQPCISCGALPGETRYGGTRDAGHYRSIGACPQLRFEALNCHAQCSRCNRHLSGNAVEYRIRLVDRIGRQAVEWLEGPHPIPKWTVTDLREIARKYSRMAKEIDTDNNNPEATDGRPTDQVADGPRAHDPPGDRADGAAAAVRAVPAGPG